MKLGHEREKKIANRLSDEDITTIIATLDFFNEPKVILEQSILDLRYFRYRVFDWLATNLDREISKGKNGAGSDPFVALAHVYLNTPNVEQFVEALRFNDLQLFEGSFDKPEFADSIRKWQVADEKWKSSEQFKQIQREGIS